MKESGIKTNVVSDIVWNTIGAFVPIFIGFARTPVFTRYFTPEEYGYYGIISITYTIISIFLFNWLTNCVWRFYTYYKNKQDLDKFYFNLFFIYACFSIISLFISVGWSLWSDVQITKRLTILIFIQLLINYPINYLLIVDRLEYRTRKYNMVQMTRALLSFIVLYILTFIFEMRIESIPIATFTIDFLVLIYVIPPFIKKIKFRIGQLSVDILKSLFSYSAVGIISGLSFVLLASSDRYLIAYYGNMKEVGIYNQVYNLGQISIMALVNVFFAMINPNLIKSLENNFKGSNRLTKHYFFSFCLVLLPITVYLSMFAYQLSVVLLGQDFRTGYDIIPYVMFSSLFYGMTLFPDNRLKFSSQYTRLIIGILICSILNIILNIAFIPVYTYKFAGFSTLICYSLLMVYYFYLDIKQNSFTFKGWQVLIPSLSILFCQWVIDYILRHYMGYDFQLIGTLFELVFFVGIYALVVYLFSEKTIRLFFRNLDRQV